MSQRPTHVLLVDDDVDLLDLMTQALARVGCRVTTATDGEQALVEWQTEPPDLVLLDVNLPKLDGFAVCGRIKAESRTPVILLTARHEEADVLRGLTLGADDYVVKPFSHRQLLARMEAVLRRYRGRARESTHKLRVGDLVLDGETHIATKAGRPVPLTRLELRLLELLMANAGQVVAHARLVEYRSGPGRDTSGSARLRTHISHLRTKLELPASGPGSIEAVPGVGYTLTRGAPPAGGPVSLRLSR
jgi:DNA-binding response OmpR family regulator